MGAIKALLVGVSSYPVNGYSALPYCRNDILAVKTALIEGLRVLEQDITLCGLNNIVTSSELIDGITSVLSSASNEDSFIFYFSGHGGSKCLALSDGNIPLQMLIDAIESVTTKNKIVILDSCHSGDFYIGATPMLDLSGTIDSFAGRGYAVLASCGANQTSGFNNDRKISVYTGFLVDALASRTLIRQGKKSLEMINESISLQARAWNRKNGIVVQTPIFRSNIGGTIYFDVEEYNPYRITEVYEETDRYIIYKVEPVHTGFAKRLAVKVILRFKNSLEEVAAISAEVKDKVLYCEVHQNDLAEQRHQGKAANIVWCYFGYCEDDVIDSNYFCRTTWVDEAQDKNWWYRESKDSRLFGEIHLNVNSSYDTIKRLLHDEDTEKYALISETRRLTEMIVSMGEKFIRLYREYRNHVLSEEQLMNEVDPLNDALTTLFLMQGKLPYPPKELNEWSKAHTRLAGSIQDFALFFDKRYIGKWTIENRIYLMDAAIKRYEADLEVLKAAEKLLEL